MRDDLNKGGNLVSVQEAARLKKRIGREPGKTRRGIGIKLEDRTETNLGEFNADEHSRMLTEIERLRDKRLIKGSANRKKRGPTDFEREVEAYLRVCALSDINNTQRSRIFLEPNNIGICETQYERACGCGSDRIRSGRKG
jgi:hypothetical protein